MAFPGAAGYQPTCVIAGAGPRLGLAIAARYAREGFASYMLLRRPERIPACFSSLRAPELRIIPLQCDVTDAASIKAALRNIRQSAGGCDVLVYNAYAASSGPASMLDAETLLSEFHVNVAGALSFIRLTVDEMRARGGTVLFTGCGLARSASFDKASLSVGKAALRTLVDCFADDVERYGIRVGMVTIVGTTPMQACELQQVADMYWLYFASHSHRRTRELHFRSSGNPHL